jgi:DNA repair exonuclease SbcCD ATPase subunit
MLQLPAIIEKYHSFQRISNQLKQLEYQHEVLKKKIDQIKLNESESDELKEDIKRLERDQRRRIELEYSERELQQEKEEFYKSYRKKQIISLSPIVLLSLLAFIILESRFLSFLLIAATISLGIIIYFIMNRSMERMGLKFRQKEDEYKILRFELEEDIRRLFLKYRINQPEELFEKQEKTLMNHSSIEHGNQQRGELEKRIQELEDDKDVLYEAIMKYIQYFLEEDELNNDSIQRLQAEVTRRRQEAVSKTKEKDKELEECRLMMEKLRWEISSLEENEEQLLKNKELYEELEKRHLEDSVEQEAIKLALETIKELASDIHDSFGQQLNKAVSEIIYEVTNDKYKDLKIDEKLNIKVGWNGAYVMFDKLSAGTIDQIYLSLRLAVADLLIGKDQAPLILDDSFALYDDLRLKAALSSLAKRNQIILFTCHKREEALLKELGLTYHFVDLSK